MSDLPVQTLMKALIPGIRAGALWMICLGTQPDAILLDLKMPDTSGFELAKACTPLVTTSRTPIFLFRGESAGQSREYGGFPGSSRFFMRSP